MKKLLTLFILSILSITGFSQTERHTVKEAILNLFSAMKSSDSKMILDSFLDSAILQTVSSNKEGKVIVKNESVREFAKQISGLPKNAADERIVFDLIKVDDNLASVWAPYRFFYKGKFSHCGVNSFQLVQVNGNWKIQYLIDTRRKDACKN